MTPVAAILCGQEPHLIEYMSKNLLPEIEIIHACTTTDAATTEIPRILRGETVAPASGYGSNASATDGSPPRTDVSLIIIGAGYSPEQVQAIKDAADRVKALPIFATDRSKIPPGAKGPPPPEVIQKRILDAVQSGEKAHGQWDARIHLF